MKLLFPFLKVFKNYFDVISNLLRMCKKNRGHPHTPPPRFLSSSRRSVGVVGAHAVEVVFFLSVRRTRCRSQAPSPGCASVFPEDEGVPPSVTAVRLPRGANVTFIPCRFLTRAPRAGFLGRPIIFRGAFPMAQDPPLHLIDRSL